MRLVQRRSKESEVFAESLGRVACLFASGYGSQECHRAGERPGRALATHPKIVIIGAELRAARTGAAEEFNRLASAGAVVELPPGFSGQDAGEAAQQVLQAIQAGGAAS